MLSDRIFRWSAAGMLSAFVFLTGCGREQERAGAEVLEQTYKINPRASLSVRNLRGSISIRGAETTEVRLQATKKTASVAQLQNINIAVAADADSISISTKVLPQKNQSLLGGATTVDYVLVVPRTIKIARLELDDGKALIEGMEGKEVRANVVDGQLAIRGCCGDVQVAVANGDLDLSYEDCARNLLFLADAQLTHGNARILLPRNASFHVRARTATGKIANDFADMVELNGQSTKGIDLSVGPDARSQLNVRVTTGDIRIAAVQSGPMSRSQDAGSAGSE